MAFPLHSAHPLIHKKVPDSSILPTNHISKTLGWGFSPLQLQNKAGQIQKTIKAINQPTKNQYSSYIYHTRIRFQILFFNTKYHMERWKYLIINIVLVLVDQDWFSSKRLIHSTIDWFSWFCEVLNLIFQNFQLEIIIRFCHKWNFIERDSRISLFLILSTQRIFHF